MRYLSITGFYPDERNDDSLQFQRSIRDEILMQALAQLTEAKPLEEIEPGELELTKSQINEISKLLKIEFPDGLEYFIGTRAD
ncbi:MULTISPECIES: pyocin S6 family toxin immunity protein [Pseudomonas]|uniref:pyocin S6 family toxin immunity protein n=1 Tax=Pseudomonas TaxID=286 RepID=UPI0010DDF6F6|nr:MULTISPECIES: pyocin S6 family toxin immunity protein [Pseudomonas]MBD9464085.1 hypothetical protein [Pseudomonas sp. Pdm06]TCV65714.1 hypothetical protein EDB98_108115 [Pseudomonas fluorescens]